MASATETVAHTVERLATNEPVVLIILTSLLVVGLVIAFQLWLSKREMQTGNQQSERHSNRLIKSNDLVVNSIRQLTDNLDRSNSYMKLRFQNIEQQQLETIDVVKKNSNDIKSLSNRVTTLESTVNDCIKSNNEE